MTIHELAEQVAAAEIIVNSIGMAAQPTKYKDQLKADARFRLASDALYKARQEYNSAISKLSSAELMELAK